MLVSRVTASDTERAFGHVEEMLDCFGVITREVAIHCGVPGAMSGVYPVLRAMEDAGDLLRGRFVEGLGPAQFCTRKTLGVLRHCEDRGQLCVVSADDPVWIWGDVVAWPPIAWEAAGSKADLGSVPLSLRPKKVRDSLLAVKDGKPLVLAAPKLKNLIAFTEDEDDLLTALEAIIAYTSERLRAQGSMGARTKIVIEKLNGVPVLDTLLAQKATQLGLVPLPDGLRLYLNLF